MKLTELLTEQNIKLALGAGDKAGVIAELVELLAPTGDKAAIIKAVLEREELMSTGIGQGVAIPHAKTSAVDRLCLAFGRSAAGIDFSSLDQKPVHLFFLLVAPEDQSGPHVKTLARISRLLKPAYFRQALEEAKRPADVLSILREEELKNA